MPFEYQMLAIMTILYFFAFVPSSFGKYKSYGWKWLASNRKPLEGKTLLPWAQRVENAYTNLKDFFPAYAVAILILGATQRFDECTKWAAAIYVGARVIHYAAYAVGNVNMRFMSYLISSIANVYLLIKILV